MDETVTFPLEPAKIHDALRQVVIGQDAAVREIAVSVVKHLVGHPAGNILLIGSSGTGKTTLMRAVQEFLDREPELSSYSNVIRINANLLGEREGGEGRSVLERLFHNARRKAGSGASEDDLLRQVERGIVFVDEVDKIRAHAGGSPNVRGILAQESLLTLMESEEIDFAVPESERVVRLNTSSMLFVAGGAFEELHDDAFRRATLGTDSAPLQPVVVVSQTGEAREEVVFRLRDYLRYEDLFAYGMAPQFVSRFESIVVLDDLGEQELARIFVEPERSIFRTSREYFRRFGIDLQITRGAIRAIAWEATRQRRLGARALKEIYRRIIREREFDPGRGGEGKLVIDETMVRQSIERRS